MTRMADSSLRTLVVHARQPRGIRRAQSPRPIIFLNIDGVLAHCGSTEELDPRCITALDALIVRTNAKVLLTSAWREHYGVAGTEQRLVAAGFRGRLTGAIPSLPGRSRSEEIRAYLSTISRRVRFVIIDDVPVDRELRRHFVQVDGFQGFTCLDAALAARHLMSPR